MAPADLVHRSTLLGAPLGVHPTRDLPASSRPPHSPLLSASMPRSCSPDATVAPCPPPVVSFPVPPTIEAVDVVTDEVMASVARLLPQLSSAELPSRSSVAETVGSANLTLLVARDDHGVIVGTLTLAVTRLLTGVRATIEDVVVDTPARGGGVATALVEEALRRASAERARTVDLTSRPEREAANRLYTTLGFQRRDTHVYRYSL